jgi:hypothetical protein
MGRIVVHIALMVAGALALAGCGFADSRSPVPEFMRMKEGAPPPLEPPPDVKQLVRDHLDSVFMASAAPHDVQVSPARHNLRGPGWIEEGVILDRQLAEAGDSCASEHFEPI